MKTLKINKSKVKSFVVKTFESILVIGYIFFEELIWNVFAKPIYQYFKRLIAIEPLKKYFLGLNKSLLLVVFIVILLVAEAMGLLAAYYFIGGDVFTGILVYGLKIPIAAFTFWLFDLTKPQLMGFVWLKVSYEWIIGVIDTLISSAIHVYIKGRMMAIRRQLRRLISQYFGEAGFLASVKSHYRYYKPYIGRVFKR